MPRTGRESAALRTALIPTWWLRATNSAGDGSRHSDFRALGQQQEPFWA